MDVYWLQQIELDVPAEDDWLSASEAASLSARHFAKRRADWRLGRWTAKRALASYLNLPAQPHVLARIEIRPATSGAPVAFFANEPAAVTISLSHRSNRALCAVAPYGVDLGCDLEMIEPHSDAFIADYFTVEERTLVARASAADRFCLLALLWSAKESALKALQTGLRLDTRYVIVSPDNASPDLNGWSPLQVRNISGELFHGWWQQADSMVRTLVAAPKPNTPAHLKIPAYFPDAASMRGRGLVKA